jgi:homoserine dehydrogenase
MKTSAPELRIGIVGFGTVGSATARLVEQRSSALNRRAGIALRVSAVCRRSEVAAPPAGARVYTRWQELVAAPDVDIVVETMGGVEAAREVVVAALGSGKPVVTANKNLLAEHGDELFALAAERNLQLGFEAAVAGGVPVIRALAEGVAADRLRAIYGILNGTANYVLSQMEQRGVEFGEALAEAQRAGYAEPDPRFDVEGTDARDKLVILARLAFGRRIAAPQVPTMGITAVTATDVHYARRLDGNIRLVAAAERVGRALSLSVRPWLVNRNSMLARVEGVNNAVFILGERLGTQMFYGRGAGGDATAVAVVGDLLEIASAMADGRPARHRRRRGFGHVEDAVLATEPPAVSWYLRLTIHDRPGILARVAEIIAREQINIDSVVQEPHMAKERLSFVVTVEPISEPVIRRAVAAIDACDFMRDPVLLLRMMEDG